MLGVLAKKIGMTQVFDAEGNAIPVTVLEFLENVVTEKKTVEKHGYNAVQLGGQTETHENRVSKGEIGNFKKKNLPIFRFLKEYRVPKEIVDKYEIGAELDPAEILGAEGELIDATARPIGRGTRGRIKRWNQHRRLMTHGTKHHRQIGSAGAGTNPGRVFKGLKMPGRESHDVTISHLTVFKYFPEKKVVLVKGAVPGYKGAFISLRKSRKKGEWNKSALQVGKRQAA
ncbi:MAG: 50S ribosomal protein L3 [Candidatus Caenarcaniphilales bacterium]|nr:50S ribosomal protein L3 [Candidatus Caenarcaniphilales bacterium]